MIGASFVADTNFLINVHEGNPITKPFYIIKTPDSIIAATAKVLQLPLVTSDKDFKKISDISIIFI